jgi:C4-dicarboxylate transporter, DctM subunit
MSRSGTMEASGPDPQRGRIASQLLIAVPMLLVVLCFAGKYGLVDLGPAARGTLIFTLLFALMVTGMPVSIALGLSVLTFLFTLTQVPIEAVALKLFTGIENFEIMAIPFFILAGNFLTHGGVARRMIAFATAMVGHWYGGLALAGVVACALFAAVSGSSPATVVAIGSILMPAMVRHGFPNRFGAGVITTSGSLGILIPPSIPMVIYAVATNSSVGKLFIAGIVPGLMLATLLGLTTWRIARKNNYPRLPKASWSARLKAFLDAFWGLLLIVIVIGGIYGGIFTPTEAAAMSAVYAFFIAVFVYRDLSLREVPGVLLASANLSAMLLYIITNAVLFSFLMTHENIPQALANWLTAQGLGWIGFLLIVNILLLLHHRHHGAHFVPSGDKARDRSHSLRHPDHGQHGGGVMPPPGRAQPLCRLRHCQNGYYRAYHRRLALALDDAVLPGGHHLCAADLAVAAEAARHDVTKAAHLTPAEWPRVANRRRGPDHRGGTSTIR